MRPLISLAMIVKNGEKTIGSALSSASNFCDELVVVDTGSQDDTKKIAQSFHAKILDYKWQDDFSAARNFAIQATQYDQVFILDADEWIESSDQNWFKTGSFKDECAFTFETRNYFPGRPRIPGEAHALPEPVFSPEGLGGTWYMPSKKVRMFHKDPKILFEGLLHETLEKALKRQNIPILESPVVIHHSGYLLEIPGLKDAKLKLYQSLLKKMLLQDENAPKTCFDYAVQCFLDENFQECLQYINKASQAGLHPAQSDVMVMTALYKTGQITEAIHFGRKVPPEHAFTIPVQMVLASCYEKMEKWKECIQLLRTCIKSGKADVSEIYMQLGNVYEKKGDLTMARSCFMHAKEDLTCTLHADNKKASL